MHTERTEMDHEPKQRKMFGRVRPDGRGWSSWGLNMTTPQLLLFLAGAVITFTGCAKVIETAFWLLSARDRVDAEILVYTAPIHKRLDIHESAYVLKSDYGVHLEQEVRDREAMRQWLATVANRVEFVYQEAYRQRFGVMPPPPPVVNGAQRNGAGGGGQAPAPSAPAGAHQVRDRR